MKKKFSFIMLMAALVWLTDTERAVGSLSEPCCLALQPTNKVPLFPRVQTLLSFGSSDKKYGSSDKKLALSPKLWC
jgi:hypothetical protein